MQPTENATNNGDVSDIEQQRTRVLKGDLLVAKANAFDALMAVHAAQEALQQQIRKTGK